MTNMTNIVNYKHCHKYQTISYIKKLNLKYTKIKTYNLNIIDTFLLLQKIDNKFIYDSYNLSLHLKDLISKNITIKSLFTDNEWLLIPIRYKILYNKKIKDLYNNIDNWIELLGFLKNLGNILFLEDFGKLPEWLLLCDTYPLGCKFNKLNKNFNKKFYKKSIDFKNIKYNTKFGIYKKYCGFNNLFMSHDMNTFICEKLLKTKIPKEVIYILKFSKFKSWINSDDKYSRAYTYLANDYDWEMLPLLKLINIKPINNYIYNINLIKKYYSNLIKKYLKNIKF